uniref:flagellar biosynthesis protein FlhF n=1 Tax=Acetatifactor sp. TaxID=1872090 RepID=UPI00405602BA
MIIKKFLGKTEEEALEAAKKELGEGIVIMNVKSVKRKGLFASLRSKLVEVTVALEDDKEAFAKTQKESTMSAEARAAAAQDFKMDLSAESASTEAIEKKLDNLLNFLENQMKNSQKAQEQKKSEIASDIKEADAEDSEAKKKNDLQEEQNQEHEKFIRLLYNTMLDNEVHEKYANQVLEEIEKNKKPNMPIDYILASVYQRLILKFGMADGITPAEEAAKVVVFMGPTGVGKTTTIAKVASYYAMQEKKKVAMLTSDTYRIAAAEQLRTYANILEVPFRVIYTEEELQQALRDFKDYDYIFLDTTGHSHKNEELIEKKRSFLKTIDEVAARDTFLVLSATTKYGDLIKIAKNYKEITDYQLIFTKLDETNSAGNLLNIKLYMDVPIAYITTGQNVPDDIERFNPQKMVKQLLGGQ